LAILATLYELGQGDFGLIRRATGLTDGNLSRHLQILEEGGLVHIDKGYEGRRPRTKVELTSDGTNAFESELEILKGLISDTQSGSTRHAKVRRKVGAVERREAPAPAKPGVAPAN
jgi:DNA-binding MarR family transcriptional regulator